MKDEMREAETRRRGDTGMSVDMKFVSPNATFSSAWTVRVTKESPRLRVSPSPRPLFILYPSSLILK